MSETQEKVLEQLLKTLVAQGEAAQQPGKDRAARHAKMKAELAAEQREVRANRAAKQAKCNHLRTDGSSVIAWMTYSDGVTRGVCQHCDRLIVPTDKDYAELRAVPTFLLMPNRVL